MEDKNIYVVYVGIGKLTDDEEINSIMRYAYDNIESIFQNTNGEVIFIPVRTTDTRIECINPKYITDDELIRKHRLVMDELHEKLDDHLNKL